MPSDRPTSPTIDQLRAVVQPDAVLARSNAEHWTGTLYMRRLSVYLTFLLIRTPISANGVTWLMILAGAAAGPALLLPGIWGPLLAAALAQLQMFLDCSDGEVARWRKTSSPKGIFLDQIGHYVAEGSIGLFIGIKAAALVGGVTSHIDWRYAVAGALLMGLIWFNKSLNMMVTVARLNAGWSKLSDSQESRAIPPATLLGRARRAARWVPLHRLYHSTELTLVTLLCGALAASTPDPLVVWRAYVVGLLVVLIAVIGGHFLAIWRSPRLAAP